MSEEQYDARHAWPQGWSIRLPFDIRVGWEWTGTQGYTSRTCANIASRHPRWSVTWTWVVYAIGPQGGPWWRWRLRLATQRALPNARINPGPDEIVPVDWDSERRAADKRAAVVVLPFAFAACAFAVWAVGRALGGW